MDSKERFSNRVDDYVRYRPSYPIEALDFLYSTVGFSQNACIADVGAGTGIFSALLLERGSEVIAIEPNAEMRKAAIERLGDRTGYKPLPGSAENTGLPARSVDHIVCAQSFHWFDRDKTKAEFQRIMKPNGKVVLIWNSRKTSGSAFLEQYEQLLLDYATDYDKVGHKFINEATLRAFFKIGTHRLDRFIMRQTFELAGLTGRLQSSSYSPLPGHPDYEPMLDGLGVIFRENEQDGVVHVDYDTEIYWGELD